mgnify:CR=1 FL=1
MREVSSTFAELSAHPTLRGALDARGYISPTPVQRSVLEVEGPRDLLVSSETGSGKTVAFGLALAHTLLGENTRFEPARPGMAPVALVLAPTRELALQVQRELAWLYGPTGARVVACVGGMGMVYQLRALADGVHIVVGTPGRLCDHLERGSLSLENIRAVVLDEADEMLDLGFREELERLLEATPPARRTLLFSATLPEGIVALTKRYQREPVRIQATPTATGHPDITYVAHLIAGREREHAVVNVLRQHDASGAIVFVMTREGVTHLHANLTERGFSCVALSGELAQPERTRALQALRDGRAKVLVATDVAARGLDLPAVGLIVQADLPMDSQALQHRSGRTGRAGRKGTAVLLVPAERRRYAERLFQDARVQPKWEPVPTAESIRVLDQERVYTSIEGAEVETTDDDLTIARRLLEKHPAETLVARLVAGERTRHPDPEDLPFTRAAQADFDRMASRPRRERPPFEGRRPGDEARGESAWFTLNVGRAQKADPKWLIPILCRRGGIEKQDIGAIRVFERETRVEILGAAAADFADRVRRPDRYDPRLHIVPDRGAPPGGPRKFRTGLRHR